MTTPETNESPKDAAASGSVDGLLECLTAAIRSTAREYGCGGTYEHDIVRDALGRLADNLEAECARRSNTIVRHSGPDSETLNKEKP